MKKLITLLFMAALFITGCSSPATTKDKLIVATSSGYAPYEMVDESGNLIGFDIDLGNLLAEKLNVEIEWKDMSFDGLIATLTAKQADMAIAGISPDPSRDAEFSIPYYSTGDSLFYVLTKKDNGIEKTDDIKDKIAGVQIGTVQEAAIKAMEKDYNLTVDSRDAYNIMVQEILVGRIDFIVVEPAIAKEYIENYPDLTSFELEAPATKSLSGSAIALQHDSKWTDQVNALIEEFQKDGTIDKLVEKWFK